MIILRVYHNSIQTVYTVNRKLNKPQSYASFLMKVINKIKKIIMNIRKIDIDIINT